VRVPARALIETQRICVWDSVLKVHFSQAIIRFVTFLVLLRLYSTHSIQKFQLSLDLNFSTLLLGSWERFGVLAYCLKLKRLYITTIGREGQIYIFRGPCWHFFYYHKQSFFRFIPWKKSSFIWWNILLYNLWRHRISDHGKSGLA